MGHPLDHNYDSHSLTAYQKLVTFFSKFALNIGYMKDGLNDISEPQKDDTNLNTIICVKLEGTGLFTYNEV